jgi:hypothetical protein
MVAPRATVTASKSPGGAATLIPPFCAGEQELRGQIFERREPLAHATDLLDRERTPGSVERGDGLPHAEVAGRPRVRPGEVAREEPVGCPTAEPADRGQGRDHLVVFERGQPVEIEVAVRELEDVLRFRREKPSGVKWRGRSCLIRSRVGNSHATSWRTP